MYNSDKTTFERIKELCESKDMTIAKLATQLGLSKSTFSWIKNYPDKKVSIPTAKKIADYFGVTVDYLMTGNKGVSNNAPTSSVRIPVIGTSAAGIPLEAIQQYIDDSDPSTWEEISSNMAATGTYVAVEIKGDSMEPRIMDGDVVIVRLQEDVDNGDTAIVFVNGDEATCKKIKKRPEGVMLIPNNPEYEPMFYSASEVEQLPVRIYGKVVEVRGKL